MALHSSHRVATTGGGLPRIIPLAHRKLIRKGSVMMISLYLTLFNLYRCFPVKGKFNFQPIMKTSSTTTSSSVCGDSLNETLPVKGGMRTFIPAFLAMLGAFFANGKIPPMKWEWKPLRLLKQGPNSVEGETSIFCAAKDALAWAYHPLFPVLDRFLTITGMNAPRELMGKASYMMSPSDVSRHDISISFRDPRTPDGKRKVYFRSVNPKELVFTPYVALPPFLRKSSSLLQVTIEALGKLSFKRENSGKVRIFASMDYWTQTVLRPLHDWIYMILKAIPQDATFDQGGSIKKFATKITSKTHVFSYDLSAATDRLPLVLQVELLAKLLRDPELAVLWGLLLVGRPYFINRKKKGDQVPRWRSTTESQPAIMSYPLALEHATEHIERLISSGITLSSNNKVLYAVGQPMGALTSWGMLALTHHFIVQLAASRAKSRSTTAWFTDYLVLGDDIVIADAEVAAEYLILMQWLGVSVNPNKGLVSNNGSFEFAKEFYFQGQQCSPFSWNEMRLSTVSLSGMLVMFQKDRFRPRLKLSHLVSIYGMGYKIKSRLSSSYITLMNKHPKVLPLLTLATFPDTTKFSFNTFSDWIRSVSVTRLGPVETISKFNRLFHAQFVKPLTDELAHQIPFHDSLSAYFPSSGKAARDVVEQLNRGSGRSEEIPKIWKTEAFELSTHKGGALLLWQPIIESLNTLYYAWDKLSQMNDLLPKWTPVRAHDEKPPAVNRIGRWTRLKLRPLQGLKVHGKLPWVPIDTEKNQNRPSKV